MDSNDPTPIGNERESSFVQIFHARRRLCPRCSFAESGLGGQAMSEIPNGIICPRCIPMICDLETNFQEFEVFIILSKGLPGRMATAPSLIIATCCEGGASFIMMKWQGNKNKEWSSAKTSNCLLLSPGLLTQHELPTGSVPLVARSKF